MSAFDLNRIVDSLQSSKIKQRNDALNLLDGFPPSKLKLNVRQFNLLIAGLLKLIEIERDIYSNNATNPIISRLSRCSGFLKDLVEEFLTNSKEDLRPRHCLAIINSIIASSFAGPHNIFLTPCINDFAKTFTLLLTQDYFLVHLSQDSWSKCYRYLVRLIGVALDDQHHLHHSNEPLLEDLFQNLHLIIGGDTQSNFLPLSFNKTYLPILKIMRQMSKSFNKRESPVIIYSFKIINKLLIILSTEDFVFLHEMIKIALKILLRFSSTSVEALHYQFIVFLNIDSVHRYMSISHLPKLIGVNEDRIISDAEDLLGDDSTDEELDILLYILEMVIQNLLTRLQAQTQKLTHEDIDLRTSTSQSWLNLPSIHLRTDNVGLWLLLSGLARLIESYYRVKRTIYTNALDNETLAAVTNREMILPNNSYKRQKIQGHKTQLLSSNNTLQLLDSMINDTDTKVQTAGLQLLAFHMEMQGSFESKQEMHKPAEPDITVNVDESTVLDINFDSDPTDDFDSIVVFSSMIRVLNNRALTYWALLGCWTLLQKLDLKLNSGKPTMQKKLHQLVKLVLPLVKEKAFCELACSAFSYIINAQRRDLIHRLIDRSTAAQIENIIDLSEIGGPPLIEQYSFDFWWAIASIMNNINSGRKSALVQSIGRWFLSKWSELFINADGGVQRYSGLLINFPNGLAKFLSWIGGKSNITYVEERGVRKDSHSSLDAMFDSMKENEQLQRFLSLESLSVTKTEKSPLLLPVIQGNRFVLEMIIERLSFVCVLVSNTEADPLPLVQWACSLTIIAKELQEPELLNSVAVLRDKTKELWGSLAQLVTSQEQALIVITSLMAEPISRDSLEEGGFSSEAVSRYFYKGFQHDTSISARLDHDALFDSEFSIGDDPRRKSPLFGGVAETVLGTLEFFKFLILYESSNFDVHLRFLESLGPNDILYCILFYVNYLRDGENSGRLNASNWIKLVRLLGEGPLTSPRLNRTDQTITTACEFLALLLPVCSNFNNEALTKDCKDLVNFLLQCAQKSLLLTEKSQLKVWSLALDFLRYNDNMQYTNAEITALFFVLFETFPNRLKNSIGISILKYFEYLDVSNQMLFYRELFLRFSHPQDSVESSAAYCLFFCSVSKGGLQLRISALFNLMECSRFGFFMPYLKLGIAIMGDSLAINDSRYLFKSLRMELLKCWWNYKLNVLHFPYMLFDYPDLHTFLSENYREIVSVLMAIKDDAHDSRSQNLIEHLAKVKGSDVQSLICDSVPLIVPLAYTADGIRNSVFKILSAALSDSYKVFMREKLLLTILESIKTTDAKSEIAMRNAIGPQKTSDLLNSQLLIDTSMQTVVSPQSTTDLIQALIAKYWAPEKGDFWTLSTVYFLIRQIGKGIVNSTHELIILSLRRIKLVLILSKSRVDSIRLARLLVDLCCPLLETTFKEDVQCILSIIDMQLVEGDPLETTILVVQFLGLVIGGQAPDLIWDLTIFKSIEGLCKTHKGRFGNGLPLIKAATQSIRGESIELRIKEVESLLNDPIFKPMLELNSVPFLRLLSKLLPTISIDAIGTTTIPIVELLLKYDFKSGEEREFDGWVVKYLSQHYLEGEAHRNIENYVSRNEYDGLDKTDFLSRTGSMDYFLDIVLEYLRLESYEVVAFVECMLGALIWKFENRPTEVTKFLDFQVHFAELSSYLSPLDFHSCVLVNSVDEDLNIRTSSLAKIITTFQSFISENTFESFASQLLLSIIQEVARYTSIATLFASFVLKVPLVARKVLPSFVCFYLSLTGKLGAGNICLLVEVYSSSLKAPRCLKTIDLFADIVLHIRVGAMSGSAIFSELFKQFDHEGLYLIIKESSRSKAALMLFEDSVNGKFEQINWDLHRPILFNIYESINDEDLFFGLPEDATLNHALKMIERVGATSEKVRYNSALLDASFTLQGTDWEKTTLHSMLDDGFLGVSKLISSGMKSDSDTYEWGWKLSLWETPKPELPCGNHEVIYSFFKQMQDKQFAQTDVYQNTVRGLLCSKDDVLSSQLTLKDSHLGALTWFRTLAAVESAGGILSTPPEHFSEGIESFRQLTSWFEYSETDLSEDVVFARRQAFFLSSRNYFSSLLSLELTLDTIESQLDACWQGVANETSRHISIVRNNRQLQKTANSTVLLEKFVRLVEFADCSIYDNLERLSAFEAAKTLWAEGKTSVPVAMLKKLERHGSVDLPMMALGVHDLLIKATLVKWMADSRQELGVTILSDYVDPMKKHIDEVRNLQQRAKIYHLLAHFSELEYKSPGLNEQIKSLKQRLRNKRAEIEEIKSHYGKTSVTASEKKAVQKYYNRLKSQVNAEALELAALQSTQNDFASNAVKFFLKVLLLDDTNEEDMDRFFSLYLELSTDEALQSAIKDDLLCLPSYISLAWCTQLMARVSDDVSVFQVSVQSLIFRICRDHPFHALYLLISIIRHEKIAGETVNETMMCRVKAAQAIMTMLIASSLEYSSQILLPIEKLCNESVELAEVKSSKGRTLHLDKLKIGAYWISDLPRVPPPTMHIPVSKTGYSNVPHIVSVDPKVGIATSGLSLPKIARFFLSDGSQHKMLLKFGTDDLRQDATMEQVFEKVNNIFLKDGETRKRNLRVRTYKAVPLGPKAGVIEFVPNSRALIEVIRPYHLKHDSLKSEKAREMMKECQSEEAKERSRVYENITTKIHPVLRYFFLDNFVTPDSWFESRHVYTRGIATTSMVGHILGLGDRHCNNILLDEFTGEPIHIDLGVAFDQGKRLPIPETVPFRLTRDIVDGFGFAGVNGPFNKHSEHTLRVLRSNKEHILAILDALRWDPLYSWSISPIRKKKLQDGNTDVSGLQPQEDGSEAGTAVLTVIDKLNAGGLSVEATVRELVREATSRHNLAVIYCGWCPFF